MSLASYFWITTRKRLVIPTNWHFNHTKKLTLTILLSLHELRIGEINTHEHFDVKWIRNLKHSVSLDEPLIKCSPLWLHCTNLFSCVNLIGPSFSTTAKAQIQNWKKSMHLPKTNSMHFGQKERACTLYQKWTLLFDCWEDFLAPVAWFFVHGISGILLSCCAYLQEHISYWWQLWSSLQLKRDTIFYFPCFCVDCGDWGRLAFQVQIKDSTIQIGKSGGPCLD